MRAEGVEPNIYGRALLKCGTAVLDDLRQGLSELEFSLDQQISRCTAAIESGGWSGKNLAWAFNNRGYPYLLKGDLDHAIADFEQANHACSLGRSGQGSLGRPSR